MYTISEYTVTLSLFGVSEVGKKQRLILK